MKYIAFDIFDTLLFRDKADRILLRMWAEKVRIEYKINKNIDSILKKRFFAEKVSKFLNIISGHDKEFCYYTMSVILRILLGVWKEAPKQFYEKILELEFKTHLSSCYRNPDYEELLSNAKKKSNNIIFISDFYFPKEVYLKLLHKNGLTEITSENLFVSSDEYLLKRSGKLYKYVLKKLEISGTDLLMIGDNSILDVNIPKSLGIHTDQYVNATQIAHNESSYSLYYSNLERLQTIYKKVEGDFTSLALLFFLGLYRFFSYIHKNNIENIFFFSREGELYKKLFDRMQDIYLKYNSDKLIKTHYFYISRRATLLPSINEISKKSFFEITKNYNTISVYNFLRNLSLENNKEIIELLSSKNIDIFKDVNDFPNSSEFNYLIESECFKRNVNEQAEKQRDLFYKYIQSFNVDFTKQAFSFFDVGFFGTMQNNLEKILDKNIVNGYYFYTYSNQKNNIGFLYDRKKNKRFDYFMYNTPVVETLSSASHGSVIRYENSNNIFPVFDEIKDEKESYKNIIKPAQDRIIKTFDELCECVFSGNIVEGDYLDDFIKYYSHFIFLPRTETADLYLNITIVDNFANFNTYCSENIKNRYKYPCLINFIKLIISRGEIIKKQGTNWYAAALYKLHLGFINKLFFRIKKLVIFVYQKFIFKRFDLEE